MLLKPFAAYLTGILTTAIAVSAGNCRWGFICFTMGILFTLALIVWGLKSKQRAAWVVTQLSRIAELEPAKKPTRRLKSVTERNAELPAKPSVFAECVLGLVGLGCDKQTARWAAGQATQRLPENAPVADVLKLALNIATAREAA